MWMTRDTAGLAWEWQVRPPGELHILLYDPIGSCGEFALEAFEILRKQHGWVWVAASQRHQCLL